MTGPLHTRLLALLLLMGLVLAGCKTAPEEKSEFEDKVLDDEAALASMRYEVIDFADQFARTVEFAADQIESQTDDAEVHRRALLWKMNGIPKALVCLDHPSPVSGLLELWTLALQTDEYYRSGGGRDAFGDLQPIATDATAHLVESIEGVMRKVCRPESFEIGRDVIGDFAAAHPFESDLFGSPSVTRALPERFVPRSEDVFASVASLETEMRQMQAKLGLYMEHLPRQGRWQAERLINEVVDRQVSPQVTNAFEQLARERHLILEDVERQRLETLDAVREEIDRVELEFGQLMSNTLVEVEAIIDRERVTTLAAIDKQRRQTLAAISTDLERVSGDTVDRAYSKVWLILVVVWLGCAGLLLLARFLFRPSSELNRS